MNTLVRTTAVLLCFAQLAPAALAGDLTDGLVLPKDLIGKGGGNEFFSGDLSHQVLMQVNLWGGVGKPGIHYVPVNTDLITLLSFAGGPTDAALLGEVVIKRKVASAPASGGEPARPAQKEELLHVNLNEFINGGEATAAPPALQANDIVVIPVAKPWISQNTLTLLTAVTGVMSIVVAGLLISQQTKSK